MSLIFFGKGYKVLVVEFLSINVVVEFVVFLFLFNKLEYLFKFLMINFNLLEYFFVKGCIFVLYVFFFVFVLVK